MSAFFTLAFGPIMLIFFGLAFGNEPQAMFGGLGQLDVSAPSLAATVIGITGLIAVPMSISGRRERGVLRRFSATPLKPLTYFVTDILIPLLLTLAGIALLFLIGILVYQVRFEGKWLSVIAGVLLSTLSFFAAGYAMGALLPTARAATIVGNVIIIPMNFFSGALTPLEVMPDSVKTASNFLPMTHVVALVRGLWEGGSWGQYLTNIAVLVGMLLVGIVIIAFTFRWE